MTAPETDWYDHPEWFDLAFRSETAAETKSLLAIFERFATRPVRSILEPACGSGRLVAALAARGRRMFAFDLNERMVEFTRKRLQRRGLSARLWRDEMSGFCSPAKVDAAICTFNSFRHLLTERAALAFLRRVSQTLRPGGVFVLGLHLLPDDASDESCERWKASHGAARLTAQLKVVATDRAARRETLRLSLRVRRPDKQDVRLRSEFTLRRYNARQLLSLLAKTPELEIQAAYDFWYELDRPMAIDDELSDTVVVLRKR